MGDLGIGTELQLFNTIGAVINALRSWLKPMITQALEYRVKKESRLVSRHDVSDFGPSEYFLLFRGRSICGLDPKERADSST